MSKNSDRIRRSFQKGDDIRDAGLTTPKDVIRFDDIVYGDDPVWQVLDVYRPRAAGSRPLPVIFSVHGGGWVYGDKERYQYYCMSLAQRGFAVVNFTYRLAPEFKYPAPLEDTNLVAAWIMEHGEKYGMDTDHIFAVGDSAGANGLGLYAAVCTNPAYAKEYDFCVPEGFRLRAIALNCGVYEMEMDSRMEMLRDYLPGRVTKKAVRRLNVPRYVTKEFPPTFLMTASGDFLRTQAPQMAERLAKVRVPFVYRFYGDDKNRLEHVFHCNLRLDEAVRCNDDECAFFRGYCR